MSVSRYNPNTKQLEAIASGSRVWIGTKEERAAAIQAGTMPTNCLVIVTNDEDDTIATAVTEDDPRAVTSGAVYDYVDTMITQALNAGY